MTKILVSAETLATAYFSGKISGTVHVTDIGLTSCNRPVHFISITKGSHKVTLSGIITSGTRRFRWEERYPADAVEIDD